MLHTIVEVEVVILTTPFATEDATEADPQPAFRSHVMLVNMRIPSPDESCVNSVESCSCFPLKLSEVMSPFAVLTVR